MLENKEANKDRLTLNLMQLYLRKERKKIDRRFLKNLFYSDKRKMIGEEDHGPKIDINNLS